MFSSSLSSFADYLPFLSENIFFYQSCRADSAIQNCTFTFPKYCSETDLHWIFKLLPEHNSITPRGIH